MSSSEDSKLEKQKKDIEKMMKLKEDGISDIKNINKETLKNTFDFSEKKIEKLENKSTPDIVKKSAFQMTQEATDKSMKYLEDNVHLKLTKI